MTEPPDDLERRFGERFEAYLRDGVRHVDARSVVRRMAETSRQPRMTRPRAAALVAATVIAAAVLTVSAQRLIPASSSATPIPSLTPSPSASANLGAPAIDEAGTFTGGGLWARHSGDLYLSTDGGASWSRGTIDPDPLAMFVLDAQHAWVVSAGPGSTGNTGNPGQDVVHYLLSHTTDGGGSWQVVTLAGNYPETGPALSFVDAEHGYLLIAPERFNNGGATVFATSDGGTSWQQVGSGGPTQLQYARMFSAAPDGTLWAGAEATASGAGNWPLLEVSRDGGASWRSVSLPGRDAMANGDYLLAPPAIVGARVVVATDRNGPVVFYHSADGGQTWQASQPLPFEGQTSGVPSVLNATHWLMPAQTGLTIWVTGDAGASWQQHATSGLPGGGPVLSVAFGDAQHGTALVSLGNTPAPNGLFVTDDGGRSWRPASLPSSAPAPSPSPTSAARSFDVGALAFWQGGQTGLAGGRTGATGPRRSNRRRREHVDHRLAP